jgi:hypothetical protein
MKRAEKLLSGLHRTDVAGVGQPYVIANSVQFRVIPQKRHEKLLSAALPNAVNIAWATRSDSSLGVTAGYGLDGRGSIPGRRKIKFLNSQFCRLMWVCDLGMIMSS